MSTEETIYNDEMTATEQEHATPNHAAGFIHTVEFSIFDREGIDLNRDLGSKKRPKLVTSWRICVNSNGKSATARFNPGNDCKTLCDFETRLTEWAEGNGFNRSDVFVNRVDFAVDVCDEDDAKRFRKLSELLLCAFTARHNVSEKNQFKGMTILTRKDKNTRAEDTNRFQIEIYNKKVQNARAGVLWRLELRDWRDLQQQPKNSPAYLRELLLDIVNELNDLASYYDHTLSVLAKVHSDIFSDLQGQTNGSLSRHQFLLQLNDQVFARSQIRQFHQLCGDPNASKTTTNFCDRYAHEFVSRKEFVAFIDDLKRSISLYLGVMNTSK